MPVTTTDGNISAARRKLDDAIAALIEEQAKVIHLDDGRARPEWVPSRYDHLRESLGGQRLAERAGGQNRLPLWTDAFDALREIDATVAGWVRARGDTPTRLKAAAGWPWRPQDTDLVTSWARAVEGWVARIDALLDPEPVKEVLAACPACNQRYVYRRQSGEQIREAALQLTSTGGCTCQACRASWGPDRLLFLCRLIGVELPEGVLE